VTGRALLAACALVAASATVPAGARQTHAAPLPAASATAASPPASPPPVKHFDFPLPDPKLTPGDVSDTDIKDICFPGFGERQGLLSPGIVTATFDRYKVPKPWRLHKYLVDRLVPAELGGSGQLENLWAAPLDTVRRKRYVEQALREAVCSGWISVADAQRRMMTDWRTAVTW
jgi:hypothetical protein